MINERAHTHIQYTHTATAWSHEPPAILFSADLRVWEEPSYGSLVPCMAQSRGLVGPSVPELHGHELSTNPVSVLTSRLAGNEPVIHAHTLNTHVV